MTVLGIETSCDECAASVVIDGRDILSNVVASQVEIHKPFYGVVPEIASRKHVEWIIPVVSDALQKAGVGECDLDGIAVSNRPGLIGSLLVGLSFAKGMSFSRGIPFVGVDHILAHLYAPHLEKEIEYPYVGLLVSGGHTLITVMNAFNKCQVLGTTIDDACGEAFDKIAKFYDMGYPGGVAIQRLAAKGNPDAFKFPWPSLHKGEHRYDVSYSGLKTAVVNQLDQFWDRTSSKSKENIAASFQRIAIDILVDKTLKAVADTGIEHVVAGGGVVANSYLRQRLISHLGDKVVFPALSLCTDNAAMVAGYGYWLLSTGEHASFNLSAEPRVPLFRHTYP